MNDSVISTLALRIAQLEVDKAILTAEVGELRAAQAQTVTAEVAQ